MDDRVSISSSPGKSGSPPETSSAIVAPAASEDKLRWVWSAERGDGVNSYMSVTFGASSEILLCLTPSANKHAPAAHMSAAAPYVGMRRSCSGARYHLVAT